jgi:hypothetical protein
MGARLRCGAISNVTADERPARRPAPTSGSLLAAFVEGVGLTHGQWMKRNTMAAPVYHGARLDDVLGVGLR